MRQDGFVRGLESNASNQVKLRNTPIPPQEARRLPKLRLKNCKGWLACITARINSQELPDFGPPVRGPTVPGCKLCSSGSDVNCALQGKVSGTFATSPKNSTFYTTRAQVLSKHNVTRDKRAARVYYGTIQFAGITRFRTPREGPYRPRT